MVSFATARTITISGPALPVSSMGEPLLELRAIEGTETLSEIYTYIVDCVTPTGLVMSSDAKKIKLDDMIGKELTVSIQLDGKGSVLSGALNIGKGVREITGLVSEARFVGQANRQDRYQLILKPWLFLADQRTDYRIFQNKTVEAILKDVAEPYGCSWDDRTKGTYPMLEYQVQYGETDFAFMQRLMQEFGIYWFFEHSNSVHRLVLVDSPDGHKPVNSVAYQTLSYYPPGHKIDEEHIDRFDFSSSLQSGAWRTNDFDFSEPKKRLEAQKSWPRNTAHNELERYEWPGDYQDKDVGGTLAQVRMQEIRSRGERARGQGNVRDLVCGTYFTLQGYPQDAANLPYLVVSSTLKATEVADSSGISGYQFNADFMVQPLTTTYCPPRTVPKPRTSGPQTAMVTGGKNAEIWTDQYGRVKLKFHWDRTPAEDETTSCWVRVSYPWAGSNFGAIHIPRVGTEVIVDFDHGDPDRPLVVGQVYNGATLPPWSLPDHATQSGILTRSTDNGGHEDANAIRFEDKKGSEEVWIQAQKDLRTEVENNDTLVVGNDQNETVNQMKLVRVGKNYTLRVGDRIDHHRLKLPGDGKGRKNHPARHTTVDRRLRAGPDQWPRHRNQLKEHTGQGHGIHQLHPVSWNLLPVHSPWWRSRGCRRAAPDI